MNTSSSLLSRTVSAVATLAMVVSGFAALVPAAAADVGNNPTTDPATSISQSDATLNGTNGNAAAGDSSFWASLSTFDTSSPTIPPGVFSTPVLGPVATSTAYSSTLVATGIPVTASTTYYYAAWTQVNGTWYPGSVEHFTTLAAPGPDPVPPAPTSTPTTTTTTATSQTVVVHQADLDAGPTAAAATNGSGKWFMYNDTNDTVDNTIGSFVTGPATAPAGIGSVRFTLGASDTRSNIATFKYSGTALSSIKTLSYSAYSHSGVAGATESPYLHFNVDFTGSSGSYQNRLVFVPSANGAVPKNAWDIYYTVAASALWNYSGAVWPTTAVGPDAGVVGQAGTVNRTWSAIMADYPSARILPLGGFLGVRVGEPGPAGYVGDVDNIKVGIQTGGNIDTTAYDFDPVAPASCISSSTFDDFALGSVNQNGWSATGPYDQEVASNTYGFPTFGCQTLRVSNATTSGSFGDWIFSPSTANEAGETTASSSGMSGGTRTSHFEAQFDLASAVPGNVQPGLQVSVSPDRGDGSRMSYLRFVDSNVEGGNGIHVYFDDYATTTGFTETDIATLDRTVPHTIKFSMDFLDGPANDVVQIFIDGSLVKTGTSWEDFFRDNQPDIAPPTVDSLLIQARNNQGGNVPANKGKGFLFDNFSLVSGVPAVTPPSDTGNGSSGGNRRNGSGGGGSSNTGGEVLGASTGPDAVCSTPLFTSYMKLGEQNNVSQVILLQWFLNGEIGSNLALSGVFDASTDTAVRQFQAKYAADVLTPWGLTSPTGWFYKFTQYKSNLISCAGINLPRPVPVIDPGDL